MGGKDMKSSQECKTRGKLGSLEGFLNFHYGFFILCIFSDISIKFGMLKEKII
jgi:hypothetical protein